MKKFVSLLALLCVPILANAEKVQIDGIWYNLGENGNAEVTYADSGTKYSGVVIIPDTVAYGSVVYDVTSIGDNAFMACFNLTSITIGNSVTSIGDYAFSLCRSLGSIYIGNSVKNIGDYAFNDCGVDYVHITDLEAWCNINFNTEQSNPLYFALFWYLNGKRITDLVIPSSVTDIGDWTFSGCPGLKSITIPNSVKNIGQRAFNTRGNFDNYSNLTDVYCLAEKVPSTAENAFTVSCITNATLHVPASAIEEYKATMPWSRFGTITNVEKCATPTICYQEGKLTFACGTEGVEFISEITDEDIKKHYEAEVSLTATYSISVYATKAGCENSETATATLCWIECTEEHEDEEGNGVINIPSTPVLIQSQTGAIIVNGLTDGTLLSVYSIDGKEVGSATTVNGVASVSTTLQTGDVAIVKVGAKSVKIIMK